MKALWPPILAGCAVACAGLGGYWLGTNHPVWAIVAFGCFVIAVFAHWARSRR